MNDGEACNDVRVADSESVALASVAEPSAPSTEAEKRVAFLERNLLAYEEEIKELRERQHAAHVQVSTMWELLRRMHDMVIVFDLQGLIAFVSPACAALLGFRPDELFDRPLSSVLAPECHEEFEAHIQATMTNQQVRALTPHELVAAHMFLRKDGSRIVLDGVGQAWQRGEVVEIVFVYRDRALTLEAITRAAAAAGGGVRAPASTETTESAAWKQQQLMQLPAAAASAAAPARGSSADAAFGGGAAYPGAARFDPTSGLAPAAGFSSQVSPQQALLLSHYDQAAAAAAAAAASAGAPQDHMLTTQPTLRASAAGSPHALSSANSFAMSSQLLRPPSIDHTAMQVPPQQSSVARQLMLLQQLQQQQQQQQFQQQLQRQQLFAHQLAAQQSAAQHHAQLAAAYSASFHQQQLQQQQRARLAAASITAAAAVPPAAAAEQPAQVPAAAAAPPVTTQGDPAAPASSSSE